MVVSNIFYFHPYLGKIPILTNIFQMGWNHQVDMDFFGRVDKNVLKLFERMLTSVREWMEKPRRYVIRITGNSPGVDLKDVLWCIKIWMIRSCAAQSCFKPFYIRLQFERWIFLSPQTTCGFTNKTTQRNDRFTNKRLGGFVISFDI